MANESLLKLNPVRHTVYFRDGRKKIDAILVYDSDISSKDRDTFFESLKSQSLELEFENSKFKESRVYVKVHAPDNILKKQFIKYGIPNKLEQVTKIAEPSVPYKFLKNILNDPNPDQNNPVAKRAWATISKQKRTTYTNCERNTVVFTMMEYTKYGSDPNEMGLSRLILHKDIVAAYSLHDGTWRWSEDGKELNDRQLLAQYWASFASWYKQQPLNTVEMYFGPEVGMYFGWLGFYNKMLIIASIMGILTVLYGVFNILFISWNAIDEVCHSDIYICPYCKNCKPKQIKAFCFNYSIAYLTDNFAAVVFACAMSFWATFFMEFWKRKQNTLNIRWNLSTNMDDVLRPEFLTTANCTRKHPYTGENELYIPQITKFLQLSVSVAVTFFMILIVLITFVAIILLECILKRITINLIYISFLSAFLTLIIMMILRRIYGSMALWLTTKEYPRTRLEFDKSYMIKMVIFSLVNNYVKLIYIAFFKGKFFTYPGDPAVRTSKFPVATEVCDPTGCVWDVFILLATITVFKPIFNNTSEILQPILKIWLTKLKSYKKISDENLESWEQDYDLNATKHFRIMEEVEEMVMQYGFTTLLVAAFPLAPLMALINNMFEIRIDATKLIKYFRRAESCRATSMSVWFDTLQALTYLAVITNALFITFTSNFIPQMVYYFTISKNLEGFYLFQISKFKIEDNYWPHANITECYYNGQRYPPEDKNAYEFTYLHFYILSCRLGFALVFVLLVLGFTGIVAYAVPDVPANIEDLINYNNRKAREKAAA